MLTLVMIAGGVVVVSLALTKLANRLPRRNRPSDIDRFHCKSGIPGEFRGPWKDR